MKSRRVARDWLAIVLCAAVSGCGNRETLYHGAEIDPDGGHFDVAALMPQCGCMTLAMSDEASGVEQIQVVTRFHGAEIGALPLSAGESQRVAFDWAGPENTDVYEILAFEMDQDGDGLYQRAAAPSPLVASLLSVSDVVEGTCRTNTCAFGPLNLHSAYVVEEIETADTAQSSVAFVSNGELVRISSPGRCGCMILQNVSANESLTLRSEWNGTQVGVHPLPWLENVPEQPLEMIGFDHAGPAQQDQYTVTVEHVDQAAERARDLQIRQLGSGGVSASANVRLVGFLDDLTCTAEGAVFELSDTTETILCEFGTLNLNQMQ